jgi:UDP-N-acetylmuramyl pentapeptide synthase
MGHMQVYFFGEKCKEISQKYGHDHEDTNNLNLKKIIKKMIQNKESMDSYITNDQIKRSTIIIKGINKHQSKAMVSEVLYKLLEEFRKQNRGYGPG